MRSSTSYPKFRFAILLLVSLWVSPCAKAQMITAAAGTGTAGFSGDGGPATAAALNQPNDVKRDGAGNWYIVDNGNFRVRKISATGIITTIAGSGTTGYSGDGGPATAAKFGYSQSVGIDNSGNVFIGDLSNGTIRKVSAAGIISTYAGTGVIGTSGDGGQATASSLGTPIGIKPVASGDLYFADLFNSVVRKISASGIITTVVGNGTAGFGGDGGPATAAQINHPSDLDIDASGNMYIVDRDNGRVRKVDASGIITSIAGNGSAGFSGDSGQATAAAFNKPGRIAVGATGNIFIVDENNYRIRKINTSGTIQTFAGTAVAGCNGNGGPANAAQLLTTRGICAAPMDFLYIANADCHQIRKIDTTSPTLIVAGSLVPQACVLQLHPNPNNGSFTFNLLSPLSDDVQIVIANVMGIKIKEFQVTANKETKLNLNVAPGIYIISAVTNSEHLNAKIVVE